LPPILGLFFYCELRSVIHHLIKPLRPNLLG
jgi:hypothetical protein